MRARPDWGPGGETFPRQNRLTAWQSLKHQRASPSGGTEIAGQNASFKGCQSFGVLPGMELERKAAGEETGQKRVRRVPRVCQPSRPGLRTMNVIDSVEVEHRQGLCPWLEQTINAQAGMSTHSPEILDSSPIGTSWEFVLD